MNLSHWARHWIFTTSLAYLTFWWGYRAWKYQRRRDFIVTGILAGLSLGVSYIASFGFMAVFIYWLKRAWHQGILWKIKHHLLTTIFIFIGLGGFLGVLNYPELIRILSPVDGTLHQPKSLEGWLNFVKQFGLILWQREPVLVVLGLGSLFWWRRWRSLLSFIWLAGLTYATILYLFFHLELRYVYLFIPALAILAGWTAGQLIKCFSYWWWRFGITFFMFLLPGLTVGRYTYLLSQLDTRQEAQIWLMNHIAPKDWFLVSSSTFNLPRSLEALQWQQQGGHLRATERYQLKHQITFNPELYFINLHFWTASTSALIQQAQERGVHWRYFVVDYWREEELTATERWWRQKGILVQRFHSRPGWPETFDPQGNFWQPYGSLWQLQRLGPIVEIYQLSPSE